MDFSKLNDFFVHFDVRLLAPLATCLAIIVTTILWFRNQRIKSLGFRVLKRERLVNIRGKAKKYLEVRFYGKPVEDAHLVLVQIINNGHLPITAGDHQAPLSIKVGGSSRILMADVLETYPADLDERLKSNESKSDKFSLSLIEKIENDRVILRPVLLNDGDSLTVQMMVAHLSGAVSLVGHINGIRAIKEIKPKEIFAHVATPLGAFVMAGALACVPTNDLFHFNLQVLMPYILLFLLGSLFYSAGTFFPGEKHQFLSKYKFLELW